MNLNELNRKLVDDRDVVIPFIHRLMQRLSEKHPTVSLSLSDVEIEIKVNINDSPTSRIYKLLDAISKEGW